MLIEPAASVTDYLLAAIAFGLALLVARSGSRLRYWAWGLVTIGFGALLGGIYHGSLIDDPALADPSWTAITIIVAITVSLLLAATVESVLGEGQTRRWMILRFATLGAFAIVALLGEAAITTLLYVESLTMAAVIGLWIYAALKGQRGSRLMLAAILASGGAAVLRFAPLGFHLGWEWDPDSLYHVAQVPGLVLLYLALRRLPAGPAHELVAVRNGALLEPASQA